MISLLRAAVERGVTFFDTAEVLAGRLVPGVLDISHYALIIVDRGASGSDTP
jgi:hypothetical protein